MKMIVGLGNPGDKYRRNRHNVGFTLVDELAEKLKLEWADSSKLKSKIAKKADLILMKPSEFMNDSGVSVSLVSSFYKIPLNKLMVIHDDLDLDFGEIKKQFGSGAAGHHGVESIISNLGSKEFWRIRIGVGRPTNAQPVEDFVLSDFTEEELDAAQKFSIDKLLDF